MNAFSVELTTSDVLIKSRMTQFQAIKSEYISMEKKYSGNLSTRPLSQICQQHAAVLLQASDYIETLLVAVPM
jgi:V-type H+-transporting ATPase subunit C